MADVTPILIKDLAAQTTLQDTDYFIVGGADAKKITVAQMKSALGINGLQEDVNELNTKIAWTKLHEGVRAIADNSTPWHPTLTFSSFDIVIMDVIMQNHHKMIPFYVGHVDNQTFVDSWGYRFANDDVHRMVTLSFGISGRYFSDVGAKMLYGDSYQWADCLSSIYIDAIWGLNCIN